jgi:hypothetical protein
MKRSDFFDLFLSEMNADYQTMMNWALLLHYHEKEYVY